MVLKKDIAKIGDGISYIKMESYPGGKAIDGTFQVIINQIPPHKEFISGFLGHCGIARIKKAAELTIGIEPDQNTVKNWMALDPNQAQGSFFNSFLIFNCKFLDIIDELLPLMEKPFLYLDPPYPRDSRKTDYAIYNHEMTDKQHKELITWCLEQKVPICLSSYPNKLYDKYLSTWRKVKFKSKTRAGSVVESIYMNYPQPGELHDYRFIGKDFRQREKFKRRRTSMLRKFENLTDREKFSLYEEFSSIIAKKRDAFRRVSPD